MSWVYFRNSDSKGMEYQLELYEEFVRYWMTKYQERSDLLLVSYEELTNEWTGPHVAAAIVEFLGQQDGVDPIPSESVPCVWDMVVNYKKHMGETQDPHSLRTGNPARPFKKLMLKHVAAAIERLQGEFSDDFDLARILSSYYEEVKKTPVQDGRWD